MTYSAMDMTKALLLGLLLIAILVGNLLVAYILIKYRKMLLKNRPTYQFILNITISDLIVGVLTIPFELVRKLLDAWIFGTTLCKIVEFIEISVSGTAVFTHALIAMDRYRSVARPHLPKIKGHQVKQMVALSWIIPAVISSPYLYMFHVLEVDTKLICTPRGLPLDWLDKMYEGVDFTILYLLPFAVLFWCYFHVTQVMWGRSPQIASAAFSFTHSTTLQNKKRVTKTACLVGSTFIICYLPTFILSIVRIASGTEAIHRGHALYEASMFGAFINEAVNPVIYCAFDRNIKIRTCFLCLQNNGGIDSSRQRIGTDTGERRQRKVTVRNFDETLSTTGKTRKHTLNYYSNNDEQGLSSS